MCGPACRPREHRSGENGGACVEVATNLVASRGVVPVRDSKWADGPVLDIPVAAFAAFLGGVKAV